MDFRGTVNEVTGARPGAQAGARGLQGDRPLEGEWTLRGVGVVERPRTSENRVRNATTSLFSRNGCPLAHFLFCVFVLGMFPGTNS